MNGHREHDESESKNDLFYLNTAGTEMPDVDFTAADIDYISSSKTGERLSEKLKILSAAAKYDVSCSSSGAQRGGGGSGAIGSSSACGICHSFTADGRCVSLLKILLTNDCVYDCKYCANRRSNDIPRAAFTADEIVTLTINFYKRNYIEGLFLSSAVSRSPDDTMLEICQILYKLRFEHGFYGYIHCKSIPGADRRLVEIAGRLADRMSINIELPTEASLKEMAPQKKKDLIFDSMKYVKHRILDDSSGGKRLLSGGNGAAMLESSAGMPFPTQYNDDKALLYMNNSAFNAFDIMPDTFDKTYGGKKRRFIPAGQSTQVIVGATEDTDSVILRLSEALYKKMMMKRVYYSAYIAVNDDSKLPAVNTPPPLLREHRLYQADWLLRFYGFSADEILEGSDGNLGLDYDPKCEWALRHIDLFPVEINRADYQMLLRVPGIGVKSAKRIISARRLASLGFDEIKRLGVVMKRAQFFITCRGRSLGKIYMEPDFIKANLSFDERSPKAAPSYTRLSLFDNAI